LYARIKLGMPGSPMPASQSSTAEEIGNLVNFILSLSEPSAQTLVDHKRNRIMARHLLRPLGDSPPAELWREVAPVSIVVSPLWWRDYVPPQLQVQAVHDGQTLAVRLVWRDSTPNVAAVRPQDFEDMAALQLFKGSPEPFLGMGAPGQLVDVWLWNAGRKHSEAAFADVGSVYPNMAVDLYPFEKTPAPGCPHVLRDQPREYLTAPAAGNLRTDASLGLTATSLQARGLGTLTMRPKVSQIVQSDGDWKEGVWTVVLSRPLQVAPDAGLSLAPGDNASIAFAIWDGGARDRNGQKMVSIWQDLKLEE
jgi:hypothetical protein